MSSFFRFLTENLHNSSSKTNKYNKNERKAPKPLDKRAKIRYNIIREFCKRPLAQYNTEMYSRGRRGAPAKGVGRVTGARVQISPSPPTQKAHLSVCLLRWRRWRDRSRRRSRRGRGARPPPGADEGSAPREKTRSFGSTLACAPKRLCFRPGRRKAKPFDLILYRFLYYEL